MKDFLLRKRLSRFEKKLCCAYLLLIVVLFPPLSLAMHIMEGFLPKGWSLFWMALCLPFLYQGFKSASHIMRQDSQSKMMLALAGAFAFVLSALKIPAMTGSCSHPTGVGFGAILYGPTVMSVVALVVLLFQAALLSHGGFSTLGANLFSMGIVGPITSFLVYKVFKKSRFSSNTAIFMAAFLGDLMTYVMTSVQLSLAFPKASGGFFASFIEFGSIFALTQIPLAISEGLLTVLIFNILRNYRFTDLSFLPFFKQEVSHE